MRINVSSQPSDEEEEVEFPIIIQQQSDNEINATFKSTIIHINKVINASTLQEPIERLISLHLNTEFNDEVQIIINSEGGEVSAGWALIDAMEAVRYKIRTIALGQVSSMAAMIFITGDERMMAPNSSAMFHHFIKMSVGNYPDLVAQRKSDDNLHNQMLKHILRHSKYKKKEDVLKKILKEQDTYLTSKEMVQHGLADKIFKRKKRERKK